MHTCTCTYIHDYKLAADYTFNELINIHVHEFTDEGESATTPVTTGKYIHTYIHTHISRPHVHLLIVCTYKTMSLSSMMLG